MKQFSAEEIRISKEINAVYNSGNGGRAVEMAKSFLAKFPESPKARYSFAVMHGDYSSSPTHSPEEKARLTQIAKQVFAELFRDPELISWPKEFVSSVKNEFFWFHEMPREQYELGISEIENDDLVGGHYSACVGASMLALKSLESGDRESAREWAEKSFKHFQAYEILVPHWYNINYFAAQALACLGRYDEAIECHRAMYKKQGGPENQAEIAEFLNKIESLKQLAK